jgi:hypothetical protein
MNRIRSTSSGCPALAKVAAWGKLAVPVMDALALQAAAAAEPRPIYRARLSAQTLSTRAQTRAHR